MTTREQWDTHAAEVRAQFEAYVAAGFTEAQAADFCAATLNRPIPSSMPPELSELLARMSRQIEGEL